MKSMAAQFFVSLRASIHLASCISHQWCTAWKEKKPMKDCVSFSSFIDIACSWHPCIIKLIIGCQVNIVSSFEFPCKILSGLKSTSEKCFVDPRRMGNVFFRFLNSNHCWWILAVLSIQKVKSLGEIWSENVWVFNEFLYMSNEFWWNVPRVR